MNDPVAAHYESHLGPVYRWMLGDITAAFAASDAELAALGLPAKSTGYAIDLGAGLGLHAVPLATRGYSVIAVDGYAPFLTELRSRGGALPIQTVQGDLGSFLAHIDLRADVIVCMGDTLTHLPSLSAVESLLAAVAAHLADNGLFAATFRDYLTTELRGNDRFIPVRSDEQRTLTCFLEYGVSTVTAHDLLHERDGDRWRLRVSSYPKLRLSPDWVVQTLRGLGLDARLEQRPGKMPLVTARKAAGGVAQDCVQK
jgi:SAM-dependent methyltransferase